MADEAKAKARGNSAFLAGKFSEAITHFTEAINISPNNHILYSNRSAAHYSLSNFTQSLSDAQKRVQLKPDWPKGYSRVGAAYIALKNYSQAVAAYEKGLEIDPDNDFLKSGLADATNLSQKQVQLKREFRYAERSGEMLKLFKEMEPCFDESELGMECWAIARELLSDNAHLTQRLLPDDTDIMEKVMFYGKRALRALLDNDMKDHYTELPCIRTSVFSNISIVDIINGNVDHHDSSLFVAGTRAFLAAACIGLGKYDESLAYLNQAYISLTKLEAEEGDNRCAGNCVLHVLDLTHQELFRVKERTGRREEGVHHLRKKVEFREMVLEEGCLEIGVACKDVCSGYRAVLDSNQALPFCLKALDIFMKHVGPDTVEVAGLRRELGVMYYDLGEHEKAIEQSQIALVTLKANAPNSSDMLHFEVENAHMMLAMGRHQEVIEVLKGVVSQNGIDIKHQALSYVIMAKASCMLGNFADAKNYMGEAKRIIEKKGKYTSYDSVLFGDMSDQCRMMNDLESAMSLSKRALSFPELPERVLAECSSRIFSLVSLSGREKEEIQYMQGVVERLKDKFGPAHCEVGYGYISLGAAYLKLGQQDSAVEFMAKAKDIIGATLGHISLSHLVKLRLHEVIQILQKVVRGFEAKQERLEDAVIILNYLKRIAEYPTQVPPQSIKDLCSTMSKYGISANMES